METQTHPWRSRRAGPEDWPRASRPRNNRCRCSGKRRTSKAEAESGLLSQQTFIRNLQPVVQSLDLFQAEWPLAIQDLGHPSACTDEGLQITGRQPVLLHAEFDGFHRVRGPEVVVLVLVGLDERHQDIALVSMRSALACLEDLLQAAQYPLQVVIVPDRLSNSSTVSPALSLPSTNSAFHAVTPAQGRVAASV